VNPVADATRPKRRREGDANPDLQFLTMSELDAVIATIPTSSSIGTSSVRCCA
jgi:hypothetical protein